MPLFCSYHILTSSVIYYWTDARQHGIYLLNIHIFFFRSQWHTRLSPRVPLFCSYHILTSSVIYYWTDARQHGIYLLINNHSNTHPKTTDSCSCGYGPQTGTVKTSFRKVKELLIIVVYSLFLASLYFQNPDLSRLIHAPAWRRFREKFGVYLSQKLRLTSTSWGKGRENLTLTSSFPKG